MHIKSWTIMNWQTFPLGYWPQQRKSQKWPLNVWINHHLSNEAKKDWGQRKLGDLLNTRRWLTHSGATKNTLNESLLRRFYDVGWYTFYLMNEGCDNEVFTLPLQDFLSFMWCVRDSLLHLTATYFSVTGAFVFGVDSLLYTKKK